MSERIENPGDWTGDPNYPETATGKDLDKLLGLAQRPPGVTDVELRMLGTMLNALVRRAMEPFKRHMDSLERSLKEHRDWHYLLRDAMPFGQPLTREQAVAMLRTLDQTGRPMTSEEVAALDRALKRSQTEVPDPRDAQIDALREQLQILREAHQQIVDTRVQGVYAVEVAVAISRHALEAVQKLESSHG